MKSTRFRKKNAFFSHSDKKKTIPGKSSKILTVYIFSLSVPVLFLFVTIWWNVTISMGKIILLWLELIVLARVGYYLDILALIPCQNISMSTSYWLEGDLDYSVQYANVLQFREISWNTGSWQARIYLFNTHFIPF